MLDIAGFDPRNLSADQRRELLKELQQGEQVEVMPDVESEASFSPPTKTDKAVEPEAPQNAAVVSPEMPVAPMKAAATAESQVQEMSDEDKRKVLLGAMYAGENVSDFELAKAMGFYPESESE